MKLILIIALLFPMVTYSQNWKDLKKAAKKVNKELKNTSKQVKELTEGDAAAALKETLNRGVEKGVDILSQEGGFNNNLNVKIPFPPEANTVYDKVKKMGGGIHYWFDAFSPKYNWTFEPSDVKKWFEEEGFFQIKLRTKTIDNSIPTSQVNMNGILK